MTSKEKYISAIIPVYNEEKNLDNFLNRICSFKNIDEIICVDDGSQDHSLEILNQYHSKIRIIHFQMNKGKGSALSAGIKAAHGEIVLFLDADLLNLDQKHVQALLDPLFDKSGKAVVGYCRSSEIHIKLTEFISGQRAYFKDDLIPHLDEMENMRYGIEMFLNSLFHPRDVKFISLDNLRSIYKFEKYDSATVARQYCREGKEIIQTLPQTILTNRFANILLSRIRDFLPII
jgi:glycosyltransferase involved in cell wall biosynthesis